MSSRPTLPAYIDEELLRAPMTIDIVIDAVIAQWRLRLPPRDRHDGDPVRVLQQHRGELVSAALGRLRGTAQTELQQLTGHRTSSGTSPAAPARGGEMALINEDDVVVDIEIARCIEAVKRQAEVELRTLQTYTSALVDDPNVSRDTNPFRPECFVRALWAGTQVLPLSRPVMAALLHAAAAPLADGLQRTYQAAWQRLDDQGVTPAAHRTIIVGGAGAGGWGATSTRYRPPQGLDAIRDVTPTALGGLPPAASAAAAPWNSALDGHWLATGMPVLPDAAPLAGAAAADPALIDLLNRLFATIQVHFGLPPDTTALLQHLQPLVLQVALRDPALLDSYEHPLWRFMDQLVHDIQTSSIAQRPRLLGLGRNLVNHLAHDGTGDQPDFAWALERLLAARRHALAQAVSSAAAAIERLQRLTDVEAPATTSTMPLDIGSLDTVPAALLTEPALARPAAAQLAGGIAAGTQLRAYLQGEWRILLALWQDDGHELVLLHDAVGDRLWALRQGALARLSAQGLAQPLRVRSLVRRAADRVLRGL